MAHYTFYPFLITFMGTFHAKADIVEINDAKTAHITMEPYIVKSFI